MFHFHSHTSHIHLLPTTQAPVITISGLNRPNKAVPERLQTSQHQSTMSSYGSSYYPAKGANNPRPSTGYSMLFNLLVPCYESNSRQVLRQATTLSLVTPLAAMAAAPRQLSFITEEARSRTRTPRLPPRTLATTAKNYTRLPVMTAQLLAGRDGYN